VVPDAEREPETEGRRSGRAFQVRVRTVHRRFELAGRGRHGRGPDDEESEPDDRVDRDRYTTDAESTSL
jgi:hypothetical protein